MTSDLMKTVELFDTDPVVPLNAGGVQRKPLLDLVLFDGSFLTEPLPVLAERLNKSFKRTMLDEELSQALAAASVAGESRDDFLGGQLSGNRPIAIATTIRSALLALMRSHVPVLVNGQITPELELKLFNRDKKSFKLRDFSSRPFWW